MIQLHSIIQYIKFVINLRCEACKKWLGKNILNVVILVDAAVGTDDVEFLDSSLSTACGDQVIKFQIFHSFLLGCN